MKLVNNTVAADVNEIYAGYYCLGGTWQGFQNLSVAKETIAARKKQMDSEEFKDQMGRAKVMAEESLKWAAVNGYKGKVKKVWWTARAGEISRAVGYDVDFRKNPTDTLLQFADKAFLGLSAKSTKRSGDIGFKNPGLGSLSKTLGVDFKKKAINKNRTINNKKV